MNELMQSMNGANGATTLAIVAAFSQAVMLLLNSKYGAMAGKYKFAIIALLNIVGSLAALAPQGMDAGTALTHGATLATYQIAANQGYKQFFKKTN